jgi:hypothetical protein
MGCRIPTDMEPPATTISCQAAVQSSSVCARDVCQAYLRLANPFDA